MGSSKSTNKTKWSNESQGDYNPQFQPEVDKAKGALDNAFNKHSSSSDTYQGDTVIQDFNPKTKQEMDNQADIASNQARNSQSINDLTNNEINPYFKNTLQNAVNEQRVKDANSGLYGGYGSSDLANLVNTNAQNTMTSALNTEWDNMQKRRVAAQQSISDANTKAGELSQNAMNAFGKQDALAQMKLDAQANKWTQENNADWNNLSKYITGIKQLADGTYKNTASGKSKSVNTVTPSTMDQIGQGLSLAGGLFGGQGLMPSVGNSVSSMFSSGLSSLAGMFSDERLKENVTDTGKVIELPEGKVKVKTYNYKPEVGNDTDTKVGVIAQEVPSKYKTKDKSGYYKVDYVKLIQEMK